MEATSNPRAPMVAQATTLRPMAARPMVAMAARTAVMAMTFMATRVTVATAETATALVRVANMADKLTAPPAETTEEIADTRARATVTRVDTEAMEATAGECYERARAFD